MNPGSLVGGNRRALAWNIFVQGISFIHNYHSQYRLGKKILPRAGLYGLVNPLPKKSEPARCSRRPLFVPHNRRQCLSDCGKSARESRESKSFFIRVIRVIRGPNLLFRD